MDLIQSIVRQKITEAIRASGHGARDMVESAVRSLATLPHEATSPFVFDFSVGGASEWNEPGMVAGVLAQQGSKLQERTFFVLKKHGPEILFQKFMARCKREQKYWARKAGLRDSARWESISNRLRRCAQSGQPSDLRRYRNCFIARMLYETSY